MMRLRPLAGLLLALCLALTSVSLAVARVQPPMSQWVELCGATEGATVAVDADGRPVMPLHLCPDCIAAFAAADLSAMPALPARPMTRAERLAAPAVLTGFARSVPAPAARGPPSLI
jgi:hypothetical protein